MREGWRLLLISSAVLAVALMLEHVLVPGIVPVAWADEPQPLWAVETAFVLRAVELLSGGVALLSVIFLLGAWARRHLRG